MEHLEGTIRVLVKDCDRTKVPYVIPLNDDGINFLERAIPELIDGRKEPEYRQVLSGQILWT